jgi:hypothetical protein
VTYEEKEMNIEVKKKRNKTCFMVAQQYGLDTNTITCYDQYVVMKRTKQQYSGTTIKIT